MRRSIYDLSFFAHKFMSDSPLNGHGYSDGIGVRSVDEIAKQLGVINNAVCNDS
jgi:hypothetical protein